MGTMPDTCVRDFLHVLIAYSFMPEFVRLPPPLMKGEKLCRCASYLNFFLFFFKTNMLLRLRFQ